MWVWTGFGRRLRATAAEAAEESSRAYAAEWWAGRWEHEPAQVEIDLEIIISPFGVPKKRPDHYNGLPRLNPNYTEEHRRNPFHMVLGPPGKPAETPVRETQKRPVGQGRMF